MAILKLRRHNEKKEIDIDTAIVKEDECKMIAEKDEIPARNGRLRQWKNF